MLIGNTAGIGYNNTSEGRGGPNGHFRIFHAADESKEMYPKSGCIFFLQPRYGSSEPPTLRFWRRRGCAARVDGEGGIGGGSTGQELLYCGLWHPCPVSVKNVHLFQTVGLDHCCLAHLNLYYRSNCTATWPFLSDAAASFLL